MTRAAAAKPGGPLSRRRLLTLLGCTGVGAVAGWGGLAASGALHPSEPAVEPVPAAGAAHSTADAALPEEAVSVRRPLRIYGDDAHPVWFRRALPTTASRARFPRFPSGRTVLRAGSIRRDGALPLPCDIVLERDVEVALRDGTVIRANVFRPAGDGQHPALLAWGAYGKEVGGQWLDDGGTSRSGVPLALVSELQRFEGPDPAYWVNHGYAVVNPDPRGVGLSEGDITYWGRQLAEDGYDVIEWIAGRQWCTGKVGMAGNSYLAVSQWFIAAERPPHRAAIAPWEGFSDHFREAGNRGGVPAAGFSEQILATIAGQRLIEDQPRMIGTEQLLTPYWKDKTARLERITTPAYVVASWTNPVHTHGTLAGFRTIASPDKWLRVHNTQEWQDSYQPAHVAELRSFFDHFLRGEQNRWPATPRVRLSVLDPGHTDTVDRVEPSFPLARATPRRLYLTAFGGLSPQRPAAADHVSYPVSGGISLAAFTHTFSRTTELVGYLKLRLWVQARGARDMELSVSVQKLGPDGAPYQAPPMVAWAATGALRVSQRRLDRRRSTPSEPVLAHVDEQPLSPGQIVPVEIGIWPMGMRYHAGEKLQLIVAAAQAQSSMPDLGYGITALTLPRDGGTYPPGAKNATVTLGGSPSLPAFVTAQQAPVPASRNRGRHVLHFGGRYDSYLLIPQTSP